MRQRCLLMARCRWEGTPECSSPSARDQPAARKGPGSSSQATHSLPTPITKRALATRHSPAPHEPIPGWARAPSELRELALSQLMQRMPER